MAKEGYWVIRTYQAGSVGEKSKFWVMGSRDRRNRRREKDAAKKAEENEAAAGKRLARIINANFGAGDILLGLDYADFGMAAVERRAGDPADPDAIRTAADVEMKNYLRRVKRELAKQGLPLRAVAITSDMSGETGEAVRVHHHLIVSASALDACIDHWHWGGVAWEVIRDQGDYLAIAQYFLRQVRRIGQEKKYFRTRNLAVPAPTDRIAPSAAELTVPRGGKLLHRTEYKRGQPQYIRYLLPPERVRPPARE